MAKSVTTFVTLEEDNTILPVFYHTLLYWKEKRLVYMFNGPAFITSGFAIERRMRSSLLLRTHDW